MPLTAADVRNAKPGEKTRRLYDSAGLYLEVPTSGNPRWRLKYRHPVTGKERRISLGVWPDTGLKDARERRDENRRLLANGVDPSEYRKAAKARGIERAANSFRAVAEEWLAKNGAIWASNHTSKVQGRLENDAFPWIGSVPIADLTAPQVLEILRRVEGKGFTESAHRLRGSVSQIMRYGIATGRCERDVAADLRGALPPVRTKHMAAVVDPDELGALLRTLDGYEGSPVVRCALLLSPHLAVRPGELRHARWEEIDFEGAEWRFTMSKTKKPHIAPLSKQAIVLLRELEPITGHRELVFPSARSWMRPMSDGAVSGALRSLEIPREQVTPHGFRATFRTLADEVLGARIDCIEIQLGHRVADPLGRAYQRAAFLKERKELMQQWSSYLDELRAGKEREARSVVSGGRLL